jgi:hypothetical protein
MPTTYKTFVPKDFEENADAKDSIVSVLVVRQRRADFYEVGMFLVDRFCLGVKDAFFRSGGQEDFDYLLAKVFSEQPYEEKSGAWGRKFIEDAIHYARQLGFAPHSDFKKASRVFGGIKTNECDETFVFGHEGKPFYIQGPHDEPERAQRIVARLESHCGEGNYNYMLNIADPEDPYYYEDYEDDDEFVESFYAEQTGGGEPSEFFSEVAESFVRELGEPFSDEYDYSPRTLLVDSVGGILELFYQRFMAVPLDEKIVKKVGNSEEAHSNLARDFAVDVVSKLFILSRASEDKRLELLDLAGEGSDRDILSEILKNKAFMDCIKMVSTVYENEEIHVLAINWSSKNITPEGKCRVEVFGTRRFFS